MISVQVQRFAYLPEVANRGGEYNRHLGIVILPR